MLRVGDQLDRGDRAAGDREGEHDLGLAAQCPHRAGRAVDERGPHRRGPPREEARHRARARHRAGRAHPCGGGIGAVRAHLRGGGVGPQHNVRVEHREQRVEVAFPRGGQEGVDHLPPPRDLARLPFGVRVAGPCLLRPGLLRPGLLHPAAGPAGQLTGGDGGALYNRGDLLERHGEHVVQHEREPFGGGQGVQHHQKRQADRVGQHRLVLRVGAARRLRGLLPGDRCVDRLLTPQRPRAKHVQRHPRHDRGEPPAQVLHPVGARTAEPQPGLLYRVVRLACRAEHAVRHRAQVRAVLLEPFGQPVSFVHRSRSSVDVCHINDRRNPVDVTTTIWSTHE